MMPVVAAEVENSAMISIYVAERVVTVKNVLALATPSLTMSVRLMSHSPHDSENGRVLTTPTPNGAFEVGINNKGEIPADRIGADYSIMRIRKRPIIHVYIQRRLRRQNEIAKISNTVDV